MGIWDFLTADYATRQQRTRDLNDRLGGLLSYYLGPTGIPDRLSSANALLNPIDQIGEAGANTVVAFDPTRSPEERRQAAINAGIGTITAAAPAFGAAAIGAPARRGILETLANVTGPADDAAARFIADESGSVPLGRADPVAQRGDEILGLLSSGRAAEVTDAMLDLGDPVANTRLNQYLFNNYDLPMDEASRMARAAGRRDEYHGTTTGSDMTQADAFRGSGSRRGIGFVTSDNPYVASSYADPEFGSVFPMLNNPPPETAPRLDLGGSIWSEIPEDLPVRMGDKTIAARQMAMGPADVGGVFDTNQLSRGASFDYPSIEFSNILDRSIHAPRPRAEDGMDVLREFQRLSSEPSTVTMRHDTRNIRSRFARFDPRLAHLRNLNAALGGLAIGGGLLNQYQDQQWQGRAQRAGLI